MQHELQEFRPVQLHSAEVVPAFVHRIQQVRYAGNNIKVTCDHCPLFSVSVVYDCNFLTPIIDTLQIHPSYRSVDHPIYLVVDRFEHPCLECFIVFLSANHYGFDLAPYLHDRYLILEPAILACAGIFPFLDSTFIDDPIDNRHIRFLQIFSILYSRRHYPHTLSKIYECIYLPFITNLEEAVRIVCKHD